MTEKDYAPQKSESKKMIVEKPKETTDRAPVEAPKGVLVHSVPGTKTPKRGENLYEASNEVPSSTKRKDTLKGIPQGAQEPATQASKKTDGSLSEEGKEKKETLEPKGENVEKEKPKKPIVKKPVVKKTEAAVNAKGLHISTKHSMAICKFIRGKRINDCIEYLEQVITKKKAMPMRGEIPHRKGKMMSGRFPKNASENFIKLLRSLGANARENNLEEPIISEAIANIAPRPRGKFGRTQKKRTHVTIKCREKQELRKGKKKRGNK